MIVNRAIALGLYLLLGSPCLFAQSNAFTLVANNNVAGSFYLTPTRTQPHPITQVWNGYQNVSSEAIMTSWTSPFTGEVVQCPYWKDSTPYNNTGPNPGYDSLGNPICPQFSAGGIALTDQGTRAGIDIPFQLGYPNNGFLQDCCTLVYGPVIPPSTVPTPMWQLRSDGTLSDGTKVGDTFVFTATATTNPDGSGYGVSFSFTETYQVYGITERCFRGCATSSNYRLLSGSGTAQGPNSFSGFSLSADPGALTIPPSGSDVSTVTVTSTGGFGASVTLACDGQPDGVRCDFSPNPVTPPPNDSTTSTLTVSVDPSVPDGSFDFNVTGTSGSTTQTAPFHLDVVSGGAGAARPGIVTRTPSE